MPSPKLRFLPLHSVFEVELITSIVERGRENREKEKEMDHLQRNTCKASIWWPQTHLLLLLLVLLRSAKNGEEFRGKLKTWADGRRCLNYAPTDISCVTGIIWSLRWSFVNLTFFMEWRNIREGINIPMYVDSEMLKLTSLVSWLVNITKYM